MAVLRSTSSWDRKAIQGVETHILHYPRPKPLLPGATSLYALNTANLRALETILCALSMIGGEGRCLARATKPNKNLNSSHFDRGGVYGLLLDTLPSRVQVSLIELVRKSTSCIYRVKPPLITVCRFRAFLPVCRHCTRYKRASPFNIGYIWALLDVGGIPLSRTGPPCSWEKHDRWIVSSSQRDYFMTRFMEPTATRLGASTCQFNFVAVTFFSKPHNSNACFLIGNSKTRSRDVLTLVPRMSPQTRTT